MIDFRSTVLLWNALLGCHGKNKDDLVDGVNQNYDGKVKAFTQDRFEKDAKSYEIPDWLGGTKTSFCDPDGMLHLTGKEPGGDESQYWLGQDDDGEFLGDYTADFHGVACFPVGEQEKGVQYCLGYNEGSKDGGNLANVVGFMITKDGEIVELEDNDLTSEGERGNERLGIPGVDTDPSGNEPDFGAEGIAVQSFGTSAMAYVVQGTDEIYGFDMSYNDDDTYNPSKLTAVPEFYMDLGARLSAFGIDFNGNISGMTYDPTYGLIVLIEGKDGTPPYVVQVDPDQFSVDEDNRPLFGAIVSVHSLEKVYGTDGGQEDIGYCSDSGRIIIGTDDESKYAYDAL